jgi:type I restriction enzyme S subunit
MDMRSGYKETEVDVIPEGWKSAKLEEYSSFISYGFTNPMPTVEHGIYMVTAADIDEGRIQLETARRTTETAYRTLLTPKSKPKKNDILLTKDGTLGRLGLVGDEVICINQSVAIIRPNQKVEPLFLKLLLESPRYQRRMLEDAGGSTIKHIYISIVNLMQISVPSDLAEQRAIATALSDVDALLSALARLIVKKRDLKQAAMQRLLTGQIRLPSFHGEWEVKRLGDVADTDPENLGSDTRRDFAFNYITLEDVDRGSLRSHSEQIFASAPSRARRKLRVHDVLVSTVRPNLQSHFLFDIEVGDWVCSTGFCVVRCRLGVTNPAYVFAHLFADSVNQQIDALLTGSNYPAINNGDVRALQIPLPSYAEQTAIAEVLTDMDAELVALEQEQEKTRAVKQAMMQELLTGRTRLI